ncbi:MAG: preprotein translocase subunit SecE [Candidatus Sungbacteria bacterium]|uniref:Protein translocase subunit SecE n=1 Tax=Candidatus Sungiibacteriota bacterium TaxID=2750080 RepID=A0A9D6LP22_9BACT|nr:preprotein translocase subunit SecE [Candidatus Sungbacteria bacterium]
MIDRLLTYIRESRIELQKVTWLTRTEVVRYTAAVIVVSLAIALFLGGVDLVFSFILTHFFL